MNTDKKDIREYIAKKIYLKFKSFRNIERK